MKINLRKQLFYFALLLSLQSVAANYYWVGGSGNWSDINHWATSSGGSSLHTVVPSSADDVIFDANAGFTVATHTITMDVIANCHNMTWSGAPNNPFIQDGTQNVLNVYGSLVLQAGMTYNVSNIYFMSNNPETITTNGVQVGTGFYQRNDFNGAGSWTFLDNFSGAGMDVMKGTLNTNNKHITVYYFSDYGGGNIVLNLGSSIIDITGSSFGEAFSTYSTNTTINAGTSTINLLASNSYLDAKPTDVYNNVFFAYPSTPTYPSGLNRWGSGGTFNSVTFVGCATINGNAKFGTLILQGLVDIFQSSSTQTITTVFTATTAACSGLTDIHADNPGTQANLNITGATVTINNALVKDIKAIGATITATGSFDLGNNTNWAFPAPVAKTLYWVGGSGNWNDITHWSLTSGGAGGACIPTLLDNVFFDVNSGYTSSANVTRIDGSQAYCHNMTWSGAPNNPFIQDGTQNVLNVYGSLVLQAGMTYNVSNIYFMSNNPETITTNGVQVGTGFYQRNDFNGAGSWTFLDNFSGAGMDVMKGTLNTNNKHITVYYFSDYGGGNIVLNLGSSIIDITGSSFGEAFSTYSTNTTINAGTSTINLLASNSYLDAKPTDVYNNVFFAYPSTPTYPSGLNRWGSGGTFNSVTFVGCATINGNAKFGTLILQGLVDIFQSSSTQTITTVFTATTAACSGLTDIHADNPGTQANLNITGATVTINNALVKDIKAIGATITATGSFDLGNNTNWAFPAPVAKTLYWVGGSGNWNDITHWSLTSGGAGGACIPTLLDNVFFDVNSGYTSSANVTRIDGSQAYCHNMTWSGAPNNPFIQDGTQNVLNVYGSLVLQAGMTYNVSNIYFMSNNPETITTNGVQLGLGFYQRNYFNGNGSWTFLDDFNGPFVIVYKGTLNTNNKHVTIHQLNEGGSGPVTLNLGSSLIDVNGGSYGISSQIWYRIIPKEWKNKVNHQWIKKRETHFKISEKQTKISILSKKKNFSYKLVTNYLLEQNRKLNKQYQYNYLCYSYLDFEKIPNFIKLSKYKEALFNEKISETLKDKKNIYIKSNLVLLLIPPFMEKKNIAKIEKINILKMSLLKQKNKKNIQNKKLLRERERHQTIRQWKWKSKNVEKKFKELGDMASLMTFMQDQENIISLSAKMRENLNLFRLLFCRDIGINKLTINSEHRIPRVLDDEILMYKVVSVFFKSKIRLKKKLNFKNLNESTSRTDFFQDNIKTSFELINLEDIMLSRHRKELKVLNFLYLNKKKIFNLDKYFVKKNGENLVKLHKFENENKNLTIKHFLWPSFRLEDLACVNRFWFNTNNGSRFTMLRIRMYT